MTPPDSPSPRTEAGRRFHANEHGAACSFAAKGSCALVNDGPWGKAWIAQIEAEAAQEAPAPEGLLSGAHIEAAIAQASPLVDPRLSEVDWDLVAPLVRPAAPPSPASPPRPTPADFDKFTDEQFLAFCKAAGFDDRIKASLAEVREAEAAQEAPAPDGLLRDAHAALLKFGWHEFGCPRRRTTRYVALDAECNCGLDLIKARLTDARLRSATPSPAEPPRPDVSAANVVIPPSAIVQTSPESSFTVNAPHPTRSAHAIGESGSSGNSVARRIQADLDRRAEARPPEGLDEAWAAAEAALPEGWQFELGRLDFDGEWEAFAKSRAFWTDDYTVPDRDEQHVSVTGPTPAAALLALAARLSARGAEPP